MYKCFFFIVFLFSFSAFSQESSKQFAFRSLTVDEGLSQNSVVSIVQDSTGYMWFATQDGLNKYDGKAITIYNKQFEDVTRPTYSRLGKVYSDNASNVWIVSNSGRLEVYNSTTDSFEPIKIKHPVSTIFQDTLDQFYIGTYENGLFKVNSKTKDTVQVFNKHHINKTVYDFLETKEGLLVATSESIINIINERFSEFVIEREKPVNFSSLAQSLNNTIWAGSFGGGLFYKNYETNTFKQFKGFGKHAFPLDLNIQDILIDQRNRLWVATYGDGVYLLDFNFESIQHFIANKEDPFALHYNDILHIYEDYTGTIWFGTDGSGLSFYDEHLVKFNVLTSKQIPEEINVDMIRSISVDENQNIWMGTSGKGLTRANLLTKSFKTYTTDNSGLSSNRIMSLLSLNGELWIGHQNKGLQIRNDLGVFRSFLELEHQAIWKIYKDLKDNVWLCTRDLGLLKYDKLQGVLEHYNTKNSSLTSNNIRTVEASDNNKLWIGTEDNGLFLLHRKTKIIERIDEVPNKIKSLCFKDNLLWVGTNGDGIIRYNRGNKSVKKFKEEHGLANNVVYAILPDSEGNLWLSSNKGITRFNPKDKNTTENFTKTNGLQAFEYNTGAYFKHNNDQLYFGGINGLNWFNANEITYNQEKPKTVLTKFEIFGKEEAIVQNSKFRHNQNTMTFTFAAMHFSEPKKNHYKYQLINNDENWTKPEYNNIAHYTNLPPNKYTFRVLSSNYEGVWNKVPTTFSFTILKPWYATNYAWLIYSLLLIFSIYAIYRYFKFRWDIKIQLQLEHAETERLKNLDEFKAKLYIDISHEFRTPLTLIGGLSKVLQKDCPETQVVNSALHIEKNSNRLLILVNQMLDLVSLDAKQIVVNYKQGDIISFTKATVSYFNPLAESKQVKLRFVTKESECVMDFDDDKFQKIINNLLSNAVKFTQKKGKITVEIIKNNLELCVKVIDTGAGIKKEHLPYDFDRYYKTFDLDNNVGSGIGMALTKELVDLMKGTITVTSEIKKGSQFHISLPITNNATLTPLKPLSPLVVNNKKLKGKIKKQVQNDFNFSILIVEDNYDIREYLKQLLQDTYYIYTAANGKEGIKIAETKPIDFIISDVTMPKMDGFEFCKRIKQNVKTSHIPFIIVSARTQTKEKLEGYKLGADAYLYKPFNEEELLLIISNLLKKVEQTKAYFGKLLQLQEIEQPNLQQIDVDFIGEIQTYALSKTSKLSVDELAKSLHTSRSQLHRKIKALTGKSTTLYINTIRLEKAKALLESTNLNISEIAYEVNFDDVAYFSKLFKKTYLLSPIQYRNSLKC